MNEAETRAEHIDPALAAAGWGVVEGSRIRREYPIAPGRLEGYGRRGKSLSADYVLEYRNTKLAVVEAKAWEEALTEGVAQAKNYAGKLAIRFTYSTNGQGLYGIDMQTGTEGDLPRYPTPDELWNLTFAEQNAWRDRFAAVPFEDRGGYFQGRYYQDIAIERVLEAIVAGKQRILLCDGRFSSRSSDAFCAPRANPARTSVDAQRWLLPGNRLVAIRPWPTVDNCGSIGGCSQNGLLAEYNSSLRARQISGLGATATWTATHFRLRESSL